MSVGRPTFHWADYLVFVGVLLVSASVGIFYAFAGGRQRTAREYLMANRQMSVFPTSVSILMSFMSAVLVLGTPAEMYTKGAMMWLQIFGMSMQAVISAIFFVPLMYPLHFTSSYEYLLRRYNSHAAKLTGSILLMTAQILYMGICIYTPSTAFETVTGFPTWASIVVLGAIGTFYTAIGGIKAVIWTDVFQGLVMIAGMLAIVIQGSIKIGGIGKVWRIAEDAGRMQLWNFDFNPTVRHTFWGLMIGRAVPTMFAVNQPAVQRYCSVPTQTKARITVLLVIPGLISLMSLSCLTGLVMFAYYDQVGCDPLKQGYIKNPNQLVPYFVMDVLNYPGFPGLFIAVLYSGALSSLSSSLNSLSAVTWEDILKFWFGNITESRKALMLKGLACIYGVVGVGVAFLASQMGGHVMQAVTSFTSVGYGPLLGLFVLGACFPSSNWLGAVVGGITGLVFTMWLSVGKYSAKIFDPNLPTRNDRCPISNDTLWTTPWPGSNLTTLAPTTAPITGINRLYTVSYVWYSTIGAGLVVVIGLLVSCISGFTLPEEVESRYMIPCFDRICCCLPWRTREVLHCGVDYKDNTSPAQPDAIEMEESAERKVIEEAPSNMADTYLSNWESHGSKLNLVSRKHGAYDLTHM